MGGITSSGFSAGRDAPLAESPPPATAAATGTESAAGSDKSASRSISSTERGFSEGDAGTSAICTVSSAAPSSTTPAGRSGFSRAGTGTGFSTTFSTTTVRTDRLKETPTISNRTNASPPSVQQATPNARSLAPFSGGRDSLIRHVPRPPAGQAARRHQEFLHNPLFLLCRETEEPS